MIKYCVACEKDIEVNIIQKKEKIDVKGQTFEVESEVHVCPLCGEELWDDESVDLTLITAYNLYRKANNLLLPEEIKELRLKYDLSQVAFARILGFGDKTIARYETGSLQDKAQNNLLLMMQQTSNFITLWELNKESLSPAEIQKTEKCLKEKCTVEPSVKDNVIYHDFTGVKSSPAIWNNCNVDFLRMEEYDEEQCFSIH